MEYDLIFMEFSKLMEVREKKPDAVGMALF